MGPGVHPPGKVLGTDLGAQTGPAGPAGPGPPQVDRGSGSARTKWGKGQCVALGAGRQPLGHLTLPRPSCRVQPKGHFGWGWGLLLPTSPVQASFTVSWWCRCPGGTGLATPLGAQPGRPFLSEAAPALGVSLGPAVLLTDPSQGPPVPFGQGEPCTQISSSLHPGDPC